MTVMTKTKETEAVITSGVPRIHTGSTLLDEALGGGVGLGRFLSVAGLQSTGKTQIAIELAANFAKQYPKGRIWYVDAEAAFDAEYAEQLGLPIDRVEFLTDVETVEDFTRSIASELEGMTDPHGLYIVDSLDALTTEEEQEAMVKIAEGKEAKGSYGTSKAKGISAFFRNIVIPLKEHQVTLMMVSQLREDIGAQYKSFKKSGGRAVGYYASQSIMLKKIDDIEPQIGGIKRITGVVIRAKVDKNKLGKPFRECEFPIMFDYGIDDLRSCLEFLAEAEKLSDLGQLGMAVDTKTGEIKALAAKTALSTVVKRLEAMLDKPEGVKEFNEASKLITTTASKVWQDIEKGFGFNRPSKY